MEGKVTLGYWAIRGLSERIRQLLEYCGVQYTQELYDGTSRDKWFNETKPKLLEKNPAITLPYLIDGDKVIAESDAICIYVCYKGNKPELLGRNADEQVLMATVHGVYKDFHPNYIRFVYGKHEDFEADLKEAIKNWEGYVKKLSGLLGNKQFIAGELTWLDFAIADFMQTLDLLSPEILKPCPNLIEYYRRVWALP